MNVRAIKTIAIVSFLAISTGCSKQQDARPVAQAVAGVSSPSPTTSWMTSSKADPLTDKKITTATLRGEAETSTAERPLLVARCTDRRLEAYIDFASFLNSTDAVPIRYRFDNGSLSQEKWSVSTDGTATFVNWPSDADFLRDAAKAVRLIVEATDFRGTSHRASFVVAGGRQPISSVLSACNLSITSLADSVPGLRREIAAELERFGPKQISTYKEILSSLSRFKGPFDSSLSPEFAIATQDLVDEYTKLCKSKYKATAFPAATDEAMHCFTYLNGSTLSASRVLYGRAKGVLHKRAGELRGGD